MMKVDEYLQRWAGRDGEYSKGLQDALDGNTTEASRIWIAIANGDAEVEEALIWVKEVGRRIREKVVDLKGATSSERERAALRAIGIIGRVDEYKDAKEWMKVWMDFDPLDEQGNALPRRRISAESWLKMLQSAGYMRGVAKKTALNRINEWRNDFGIE